MALTLARRQAAMHVLAQVLAEADRPMARDDVFALVAERFRPNEEEAFVFESGTVNWIYRLAWDSVALTAAGWIVKDNARWSMTDAGRKALTEFPEPAAFAEEASRLYGIANAVRKAKEALKDPRAAVVSEAVAAIPQGWWTSFEDLAELSGLTPAAAADVVRRVVAETARHRAFDLHVPPTGSARDLLDADGVRFDEQGVPQDDQRATADDLRLVVGVGATGTRAWLVRGSAVSGVNVVPEWTAGGYVSIAAAHLTPVSPGMGLEELQKLIESDYAHLSYHQRKAKLVELNAFLNRMQPGDWVLTTSEGQTHAGRLDVTGALESTSDPRTTIRRPVSWRLGTVDFPLLPEQLQAKLRSNASVMDLTDVADLIETTFGTGPACNSNLVAVFQEAVLADLDATTVDRLLVGSEWLHEFVDLLRARRQVILHGPPGTGKTFLALEVAEALTDPQNVTLVQFHPAYSYEDFFEGYRPTAVDDSGRVGFALTPGPFRKVVDAARENPSVPQILIIDEINRANLAKVFGELYFLLEYRDRAIDLMYASGDEGRDFSLPRNVYVIGTMNTADRSIALVDAAMRRRFAFLSLHPSDPHLRPVLREWLVREGLPTLAADLLDVLNQRVPDRDFAIGPSYVMRRDEVGTEAGLARIWRTSILPLLEELHYGEAGFDVERRYGLAVLKAALPQLSTDAVVATEADG